LVRSNLARFDLEKSRAVCPFSFSVVLSGSTARARDRIDATIGAVLTWIKSSKCDKLQGNKKEALRSI